MARIDSWRGKRAQNRLVCLGAGLALAVGLAVGAQAEANGAGPRRFQPGALDRGEIALDSPIGCSMLVVVIQNGSSPGATVPKVSCDHGYFLTTLPASGLGANPSQPAVLVFMQSTSFGPDCSITVSKGSNTAVLAVQQNYCFASSASITASVVSGSATMNGTATGSFGNSQPGMVWFTVN